jgi:hypothetical protein
MRCRVGIATGMAIVGDLIGEGVAQERGVVGETPNLAARQQGLAAPNTLIIDEATRRQVGGLFDLADLGPQALTGFAEPQPAWRVIGESGMLSRFEALRSGATPLVGRDEEVGLLLRRWHQAKSGEGRVVLIAGEPGIGKSRLTAALSENIESERHTRLRFFCSPHHQDSALYPFIAQLERAAGFARDDMVDVKLSKLRRLIGPGARDDDDIPLLSEMLSLPSTAANLTLSPQRKREKLFEAMLNQLEAEARRRPLLMVFEDVFQPRLRWPEMSAIGPLPVAPAMAVSPRLLRPRHQGAQMPPTPLRSPQMPPPSMPSANCTAGSLKCRAAALPPQPCRLRLLPLPAAQPSASGSTSGGA